MKDSDFDKRRTSHEVWDEPFHGSVKQYTSVISTDDPDLSDLRKAGGKLINWHGAAD